MMNMKTIVLTFLFVCFSFQLKNHKKIKQLQTERITRGAQPRKLMLSMDKLMGNADENELLKQATQHSDMAIMVAMSQTNEQLNDIMQNVQNFQKGIDELAEAVNTQIVQLSSVANNNLNKNVYLGRI